MDEREFRWPTSPSTTPFLSIDPLSIRYPIPLREDSNVGGYSGSTARHRVSPARGPRHYLHNYRRAIKLRQLTGAGRDIAALLLTLGGRAADADAAPPTEGRRRTSRRRHRQDHSKYG
ncbi:hypothetical protein EVAR_86524_1 [Eumeta japonica]|uniref:Uncharacterized protein n=1 Tax=Eumeta variegata TaxID=151549 RepID=A0A4C1VMN9_EUMVA|nr:hypothetical protein EVAR_86524_1 [Eumeta japonica]